MRRVPAARGVSCDDCGGRAVVAHVARAAGGGQAGVSRLSILRGRAKCKAKRVRALKKTRKLKKQFNLNYNSNSNCKVYSSHPR